MQLRLAVFALPLLGACLDDVPPETSEAAADISYGGAAWSGDIDTNPLVLAPITEQTCFLSGITGDFRGSATAAKAAVEVRTVGGVFQWVLGTKAGAGTGTEAFATCVPASSGGGYLSLGGPAYVGSLHSQCFLQSVSNVEGLGTAASRIQLLHTDSGATRTWTLFASTWEGGATGVGASAVCLELPAGTWSSASTLSPPASGSTSFYITDATGATIPTANTACALTQVSGNWVSSTPRTFNDGVFLRSSGVASWRATTSAQRAAVAECVR